MKILFIHGSHNETGGDTVYINLLINELASYNVTGHLISVEQEDNGYSVRIKNLNTVESTSVKDLGEVNNLVGKYCARHEIDLIHIHTIHWPSVTEACLALRPVVKTPHATDLICPGSYKFYSNQGQICDVPFGMHCLVHAYTKRCCSRMPGKLLSSYSNVFREVNDFSKRYKNIVVMSEYVKSECIKVGIDAKKISVIPYFTSPVLGNSITKGRRLLYLGRLSQVKGVHVILTSLAPLLLNHDDVFFDIIGDGPYRETIETIVDSLKIRDKVIFYGWKDREGF